MSWFGTMNATMADQANSTKGGQVMKSIYWKIKAPLLLSILSLALATIFFGCNGGSAEAQTKKRIETFAITQGTFLVISDVMPTIDVKGSATVYTLAADNTLVQFTDSEGSASSLRLNTGDIIVEWPESGHLTLIRDNP
jgi:hypothetical protein